MILYWGDGMGKLRLPYLPALPDFHTYVRTSLPFTCRSSCTQDLSERSDPGEAEWRAGMDRDLMHNIMAHIPSFHLASSIPSFHLPVFPSRRASSRTDRHRDFKGIIPNSDASVPADLCELPFVDPICSDNPSLEK